MSTFELHECPFSSSQNLQDFLDLYYEACNVLQEEEDFYDLAYAYFRRAAGENVYVAEIFFDPQTHTDRGVSFDTVITGLHRATVAARLDFGIRAGLIMCFLRHLSEEAAIETLRSAKPHLDKILAVGLDSGELGNPPSKFARVYKKASKLGLKLVAHAGEEAGPEYIVEALDILKVQRVDHGVQCLKDEELIKRLVTEGISLTTCPLSNQKLQINSRFFNGRNVTKELLKKGLKVTVNSDDPAYFGGYINKNFLQTASEVGLTEKDVYVICRNAFQATFLPDHEKEQLLVELNCYTIAMGCATPARSVSIFGSRRPPRGSPEYEDALKVATLFSSRGFRVVTGGYFGIMEAGSRGGREGAEGVSRQTELPGGNLSGETIGILSPQLFPHRGMSGNTFLTHSVFVRNLTDRLHRSIRDSEYFIVFGGTIGTITELMVVLNAAGIRRMFGGVPQRIFLWRAAWEAPLKEFLSATNMYPEDVALLTYVDSAEEVVGIVEGDLAERAKNASITLR